MFKNAQIGDRVWDVRYGWGKIITSKESSMFRLTVEFINSYNDLQTCSYTIEGRAANYHNFPTLLWNEFKIPPEAFIKPLPKLAKDTKVLVWDEIGLFNEKRKQKGYFSHFDKDGIIYCYGQGRTSWSGTTAQAWDNWELYKEYSNE